MRLQVEAEARQRAKAPEATGSEEQCTAATETSGPKHHRMCADTLRTGRSAPPPGTRGELASTLPAAALLPGWQSRESESEQTPVPGGTVSSWPLCPRFWVPGLLPRC